MPKGVDAGSRPAGVDEKAIELAHIALGEVEGERKATSSAAAQLGRLGGAARARKLTAAQRVEIARTAAEARWRKAD